MIEDQIVGSNSIAAANCHVPLSSIPAGVECVCRLRIDMPDDYVVCIVIKIQRPVAD